MLLQVGVHSGQRLNEPNEQTLVPRFQSVKGTIKNTNFKDASSTLLCKYQSRLLCTSAPCTASSTSGTSRAPSRTQTSNCSSSLLFSTTCQDAKKDANENQVIEKEVILLTQLKWSDTDNFNMNLGCHKGGNIVHVTT